MKNLPVLLEGLWVDTEGYTSSGRHSTTRYNHFTKILTENNFDKYSASVVAGYGITKNFNIKKLDEITVLKEVWVCVMY